MSMQKPVKRRTAPEILARKGATPIVSTTAYSAITARLVDPIVDFMLVGDSLAMVEHGMASTLGVGLDLMVAHGRAVVSATVSSLVVVDMPFGSYEASPEEAFRSASRLMAETGCGAVKLEGGVHMAETIAFLVSRGIPVMAHVGLTPQAVNALGGFRSQGHDEATREKILGDAVAISEAGAFAVVVEGVVEPLADEITRTIPIPTIGIGASAACDGQVLVLEDMLGLTERVPRFVKRYAALGDAITEAVQTYADEVRERRFPSTDHVYKARG
ncbi:3-methyl-2-oxobutanoate hydroxymethyltransferase [Jiella marina]|uniref:3-methyl-2-oxobutanoate hydroxymethyltransferase n=1 Tax=Jiella sp. LLJ827 TaxID=2917712 RepID=UPI002100CE83|nr:3-methyl-2-oxobutanoate hydroxymethyltransferase [Jiella sp. LLJ827]MCQ0989021.1 3-methyl-2-oxobutanoate hydroxymethyltransferase [Jiella sp. LLJ827]